MPSIPSLLNTCEEMPLLPDVTPSTPKSELFGKVWGRRNPLEESAVNGAPRPIRTRLLAPDICGEFRETAEPGGQKVVRPSDLGLHLGWAKKSRSS